MKIHSHVISQKKIYIYFSFTFEPLRLVGVGCWSCCLYFLLDERDNEFAGDEECFDRRTLDDR